MWCARVALAIVFVLNVSCAVEFIAWPERYAGGFEVSGVPGTALVRGMGILFLMWNTTYPLPLWDPWRYRALYVVLLVQQAIGVVGETWMILSLPPGHATLASTGWRFVAFDAGGLAVMLAAFLVLLVTQRRSQR